MPIYKKNKQEALKRDQVAVPYSFRHRYSKESHAYGMPISNIALSMGHSVEVHLDNYARYLLFYFYSIIRSKLKSGQYKKLFYL